LAFDLALMDIDLDLISLYIGTLMCLAFYLYLLCFDLCIAADIAAG
jgi:hypothetical protein